MLLSLSTNTKSSQPVGHAAARQSRCGIKSRPVRHSYYVQYYSTVGPNAAYDLRHYTDLLQVALPTGARSPCNPMAGVEGPEQHNSSALVGTNNNPSSTNPLCLAAQTVVETLNPIRQEPTDAESCAARSALTAQLTGQRESTVSCRCLAGHQRMLDKLHVCECADTNKRSIQRSS